MRDVNVRARDREGKNFIGKFGFHGLNEKLRN